MPTLHLSDDDESSNTSSNTTNSTNTSSLRSASNLDLTSIEHEDQHTAVEPHTGFKCVLVTGGAGFIGSHVAQLLLERGDKVVIIDEMNEYYDVTIKQTNLDLLQQAYGDTGRLKIYKGDICNVELMTVIFEMEQPKWVCHMAARAGVRPSIEDPYVYIHSSTFLKNSVQSMNRSLFIQPITLTQTLSLLLLTTL